MRTPITLEDLIMHFSDEFRFNADWLKHVLYAPNKTFIQTETGERISLDSKSALKVYLQREIDAYQAAIDEIGDDL